MSSINKTLALCLIALFCIILSQCSHYDSIQANPMESSFNSRRSHNAGQDCGSCHNNNSNWDASSKWWTVAGTVFSDAKSPKTNVTIELWDQPNRKGNLIKKLYSDPSGNFYTNQIINFSNNVYPVVYSTDASQYRSMQSAYNGGSCGKCHSNPDITSFISSN